MQKQGSIISGSILILVGIFFLLIQFFPSVADTINFDFLWPLIVLGVGLIFLFAAVVAKSELAVPGTIISGVGLILFYQNTTGNWGFWQLWLLVPAVVGAGIFFAAVLGGKNPAEGFKMGAPPLLVGLILFIVFSFSRFWPVLVIAAGIFLLIRNLSQR